ncbi:hypothetical protein TNCV_1115331 [Trichonephila clavipes]|nr:hypothetical protein TNCV_1115331 [Trichonephila clavipes]
MLPNSINLKYEAISVPQGSVRLVKKTRKKKSNFLFVDHQRCHEFEASTTKDPPCRGEMHVKSVESANVLFTENSSSTSTQNSKSDLLQNCLLIFTGREIYEDFTSSSEVESPSGVS